MKHHGMFEHYAKVTMNEIMEKYLLIIYSKFSNSSGLGINNDTPQTNITKQNLETRCLCFQCHAIRF